MSKLTVYADDNPSTPLLVSEDHAEIARVLSEYDVRFEQWQASQPLEPGASPEAIKAAYAQDIARLQREGGYQACDVISLNADHPDKDALRRKFLDEHRHSEDEVRFFVAGSGLFCLHMGDKVFQVLCTRGDLISVPDNTPHWFDMSDKPSFIAIRLFTNTEGWVANFTGSDIARKFPLYEGA